MRNDERNDDKENKERERKKKKEEEEEEEEEEENKVKLRDNSYFFRKFGGGGGVHMREGKKEGEENLRDNGYFTATHVQTIPRRKRKNNKKGGMDDAENHFDDEALHELEHEIHEAIESEHQHHRVGEVPELPPDGSHAVRFHRKNFSLWQHRADTVRVHVHGLKPRGWFL